MKKSFSFIHTADLHQGYNFSKQKWLRGVKQRSDDFLNNFKIIIERSLKKDIDFLVIAGDVFDRSHPPRIIRQIVIDQLIKVSKLKPVILIPGNHDKSNFPKGLLFIHPNINIYNKPTIDSFIINNCSISVTAIPFIRNNKLDFISNFIVDNKIHDKYDFRLLVLHELMESCKVGVINFVFEKYMKDVVPIELVEKRFDYVALGHVHKYQKIASNSTAIYYSGSIERTSVVEREEEKGYLISKVEISDTESFAKIRTSFNPLPTRLIHYNTINSLKELDIENYIKFLKEMIVNESKPAIIIIKLVIFDDYEQYKNLKSFLQILKKEKNIFDYSITSPNFAFKLKKFELSKSKDMS